MMSLLRIKTITPIVVLLDRFRTAALINVRQLLRACDWVVQGTHVGKDEYDILENVHRKRVVQST